MQEGGTAIFSCSATGVDETERIRFLAGSSPAAMEEQPSSPDEGDVLFLGDVMDTQFVRCDSPHSHPNPIFNTVTTKIVQDPLVDIRMSISKSP